MQKSHIYESVLGSAFAFWRENSLLPIKGRKRVVGRKSLDDDNTELKKS